MKRILTLSVAVLGLTFCSFATSSRVSGADGSLTVVLPSVENLSNPVGVDSTTPRLSWVSKATNASAYNKSQSAYQVLVASSAEKLADDEGDLWDSGKVESDKSLYVQYVGKSLASLQRCYWKVRVWDEQGAASAWSEPATWIQGVVDAKDWKAEWIGQPEEVRPDVDLSGAKWIAVTEEKETDAGYEVEYFRREFELGLPQSDFDEQNLAGILYYAACQKFEIYVNGKKAGHSIGMVFNPDQLRSIDVSEYLQPGKNVVSFIVSNETKRPNDTKFGDGTLYPTALIAKLFVQKLDKSNAPENIPQPNRFGVPAEVVATVGTDATWKATTDPGQGWHDLAYDASNVPSAKIAFDGLDDAPWGKLRRRTETISPAFQKTFNVEKKVANATLAVCAPGLFEAWLDGEKVGAQVLTPSFTRYDRRLLYNVFDLTEQFQKSDAKSRELQFFLGHSWYDVRSIVTWNFDAAPWRDFPRLLAELQLTYEDGTVETIGTDSSWTYSTSPILFDCVRQGEIVDGAWEREILGNAVVVPAPLGNPKMTAQKVALSKVEENYVATSAKEVKPGVWVVDMGKNSAGWAKIKIRGQKKGDVLRFKYSERVVESGEIERHDIEMHFMEGTPAYKTGMKGGFQTDFYFCNGDEVEVFEPRFTYNGYQYVEIVGLRQAPDPKDYVGCVVSSDFRQIGSFNCSNQLLNAIQAATLASYRNNYVAGYPTDCPHREKNGWTGDAQLACELAQYNWENTAGYEKWIDDLCDEQRPNGNLPGIVPSGDWGYPWGNGPAWDSSLVTIPWDVYLYRGDRKILEDSYEAMKKYVDYMTSRERDNGLIYHGLGDWVPVKTVTPTEVTSTGYYYLDTKIVAQTAKLLGKNDDFEKYSKLAEKICKSYNDALYQDGGVYSINSQTSQSCAIHQGFAQALDQNAQAEVFKRLVEDVEKANGYFDVGILGAKYIMRALSEGGRNDLALQMILQEDQPSYADWIKRGAGTLWEDWGEGSSRNHIMFGDVSAWFYQSLAGLKLSGAPETVVASVEPNEVAFKRSVIAPKCRASEISAPGRKPLTWARGSVETPYGTLASSWAWNKDFTKLTLNVDVPVNTTATIVVPCDANQTCVCDKGAEFAKEIAQTEDGVVYEVGSGAYSFSATAK